MKENEISFKTVIAIVDVCVRVTVKFGEGFKGEANGELGRSKADVAQQGRDEFWILFVAVQAQKTVDLFNDVAQLVICVLRWQLELQNESIDFVDANCDGHFLL